MKPSRQLGRLAAAAVFGFGLIAASAAQAFTIENQDSTGGTPQNFMDFGKPAPKDPDDQVKSRFGSGSSQGTVNLGNGSSLQFGVQPSFQERYNTNNLFDPYARDGR